MDQYQLSDSLHNMQIIFSIKSAISAARLDQKQKQLQHEKHYMLFTVCDVVNHNFWLPWCQPTTEEILHMQTVKDQLF